MTPVPEFLNINPIESEKPSQKLTYHHARPLEAITYGRVKQISPLEFEKDKDMADYFDSAYKWLESKLGFYPLFLAVGRTNEDVRMTGYQNQWARKISSGMNGNEYRKKGLFPHQVLFSFKDRPQNGVFVDYDNWHLVLMLSDRPQELERYYHSIFRPSWNQNDWMTYANKNPHSVQMVVPSLDLTTATQIAVRNTQTKSDLEKMGFNNISIARLHVDKH